MIDRHKLVAAMPARGQRALGLLRDPVGAVRRHGLLRQLACDKRQLPERELLRKLRTAWGGSAVAEVDYLLEVCARAKEAQRPILECGSGLTTLLMAIYATVPVVSLEESPVWAQRMRAALSWYRLDGVDVVHAPVRSYGDFMWYDVDGVDLPESFGLVVCDGPISHRREGTPRYGVIPVIDHRLNEGTLLLLDDAGRPNERATIERWEALGWHAELPAVATRPFATVRRRDTMTAARDA